MEKHYKIEKAKLDETKGLNIDFLETPEAQEVIRKAQGDYLSWSEFKYKSWVPKGKEEVWKLLKFYRKVSAAKTLIRDKDGSFYTFNPRSHVQFLHEVDLELGGSIAGLSDFSKTDQQQIIRRNLIEESIASSKLEGANTSREVARKMLRDGRAPRNKDELMIVNNHEAMRRIEEELKHEKLSLDLLRDLHVSVTKGTLKNASHEGAFRQTLDENGKRLIIKPWDAVTVAYVTPDRGFVDQELPKLISFANDEDGGAFIHPLVKAIMLHFWIGLLHPFEDGNGRLARIIFYWYMLKKGYWAFSYLSISEKILRSSKQYAMAFIDAEQDDYDLNYFIHYNIKKIKLARLDFKKYLEEKIKDHRKTASLIKKGFNLNGRQITLLESFMRKDQLFTSTENYLKYNDGISYPTAAADMKKLTDDGFVEKVRNGRNIYYYPTEKINEMKS